MIATEFVAKAAPDGYTLLIGATGAMTINPAVYSKLPYDTVRDFVPISMIASFPLLLCVKADAPVKTVSELVAYSQGEPGAGQLCKLVGSLPARHRAVQDEDRRAARAHRLQEQRRDGDRRCRRRGSAGAWPTLPQSAATIKAGRIRALATTAATRMPDYPGVPTMAEAGVPDLEVRLWSGLFAPAATPAGIVKKLEKELMEIIKLCRTCASACSASPSTPVAARRMSSQP